MSTTVRTRWGHGGLPVELTSFVGRRHEIGAVKAALSGARVVTLTGVGGIGKTRLALRVCAELRRAFADGVCFIDLSSVMDGAALDSSMMEALQIHSRSNGDPVVIVSEFLRERQVLLVLDNCEQIVGESAALINTVIRSAPLVRVLVTSRERLGVTGEYVWQVPPLSVPGPDNGVEFGPRGPAPAEYPALVLFVERAAAVSGFAPAGVDWPDVIRLCRSLDGLPLAIELAAVQTRAFTPGQLVRRLSDWIGTAGTVDDTVPDRHRSLEAAIDWSYGLCSPDERLLWARASVFAGRFALEAAEGICSGADLPSHRVLNLVAGLVDKSVLLPEPHLGEMQYRFLESLAQYGRTRLREAGEEKELVGRHRDWYLQTAERMAAQWYGPDQLSWSNFLRREDLNLRAALDYCLATPGEEQAGLRFTAALLPWWVGSGGPSQGQHWLERALATDREPTTARAMSLRNLALLCGIQFQEHILAEAALKECRTLAGQLGDPLMEARALAASAVLAMVRGDFVAAADLSEEALARPEYAGNPERGEPLYLLVQAQAMLGNYAEVVSAYEAVRRYSQETGDRFCLSWALVGRALAELRAGETTAAVEYAREAVRIHHELSNAMGIAVDSVLLLRSATAAGDFARSALLLGVRQRICRQFILPEFPTDMAASNIEEDTSRLRAEFGADAFAAAVARGSAFDLDEAVEYLLDGGDGPAVDSGDAAAPAETDPLTARERQVAMLVAQGMANKQIAAELVISPRTVEGHVDRILTKLGFTSRARIAAWVAANLRSDQEL